MLKAIYTDRFYLEAVRFVDFGGRQRRLQKKMRRQVLGLAKPITCPKCRMKTRQVMEDGLRTCLSCEAVFNNQSARHGQVIDIED